MKKIAAAAAATLVALTLVACDDPGSYEAPTQGEEIVDQSNVGGFGMTYNGKPGMDLGGGLILPYDGSGLGLGYGF